MYLEGYQNVIGPIQKASLDKFMAGSAPAINITNRAQVFEPYYVDSNQIGYEELNSRKFNRMQSTLSADLSALFSHGNYTDMIMRRTKEQITNDMSSINNDIDSVYRALDKKRFKITKNIYGFNAIHYTSFRDDTEMESSDSPLYSGNYKVCEIDKRNSRLCVPHEFSSSYIVDNHGRSVVDVEITEQRGVSIGPVNRLHEAKYAVDSSPDTYWSELVLTDEPYEIEYNYGQNPSDGINKSCVSVLRIDLKGHKSFNEIRIKPFCEWPLYLVGVYGVIPYNGTDTIVEYIVSNTNGYYEPLYLDSSKSFLFPSIQAAAVIFIFAQPHYKKASFRLPKYRRENYEIFNTIYSSAGIGSIDYSQFDTDSDLLQTSKNIAHTMVREIDTGVSWLTQRENVLETYSKYEYSYGAYDIQIKYNEYEDAGEYISRPIKSKASIGQIALYSDNSELGVKGTIEYSLILGENEIEVPICPINHDMIYEQIVEERIDSNNRYYLRMPYYSSSVTVSMVGVDSVDDNTTNISWDSTKNKSYIDVSGYDFDENTYVVQYPPMTVEGYHPHYIDFLHSFTNIPTKEIEEEITAFDNSSYSIILSGVPYVNYNEMKTRGYNPNIQHDEAPVVITLQNVNLPYYNTTNSEIDTATTVFQYINGESSSTRPHTYNKTNYKTRELVELTEFEGYGTDSDDTITEGDNYNIEYQIIGNRVYFNYDLSGATFNVRYKKLADTVRIKTILRSSIPGPGDSPPYVNSYALMFNYADNNSSSGYDTEGYGFGLPSGYSVDDSCEMSIRHTAWAGTWSDDYMDASITDINAGTISAFSRRFDIYNTGNIDTQYKIYLRATTSSYNDPGNDMQWTVQVWGPGAGTGNSFTFDAHDNGYPLSTAWWEYEFPTPVTAGATSSVTIQVTPSATNSTCDLSDAKLIIDAQLEAIDDIATIKCKRSFPSFPVAIKGV